MGRRPGFRALLAPAVLVASLLGPGAHALAAGYQVTGHTLDAGGGTSSSPGYVLVSCLGNDAAGAASSAGFRVEAGCGSALTLLAGLANILNASGGSSQTAGVNHLFPLPLKVTVLDGYGNPVAGVTVTFTPPGSGASAVLSGGGVATTDATGVASVTGRYSR